MLLRFKSILDFILLELLLISSFDFGSSINNLPLNNHRTVDTIGFDTTLHSKYISLPSNNSSFPLLDPNTRDILGATSLIKKERLKINFFFLIFLIFLDLLR